MMNPSRPGVGARVSDAAAEALQATTHALDTSRQFASDAAGRIGAAAQGQLGKYASATRRHVAREPLQSALIAAAIGAAAAALVLLISGSRRDKDQER